MQRLSWFLIAIVVVSFIGFLDATYLTIQHYNEGILDRKSVV